MGRSRTHVAKIVWCFDKSVSEVKSPDAINDGTPSQWILRIREPARKGHAAETLGFWIFQRELIGQCSHARQRARSRDVQRFGDFPALEHADFPGRSRRLVTTVGRKIT